MKEINRKPGISEEGSRQEDEGILPFPARGQALKMRSRDSEKKMGNLRQREANQIHLTRAKSNSILFERLHQRDTYPGTGLGLALSRRIIGRHGGRMWVESATGNGLTFYVTLPVGPHEVVI